MSAVQRPTSRNSSRRCIASTPPAGHPRASTTSTAASRSRTGMYGNAGGDLVAGRCHRRRRRDRRLGGRATCSAVAASARLDPRRPRRPQPARPERSAQRRDRLRLPRGRRSGLRRDGRLEALRRGRARAVRCRARGRRCDLGARPRLGPLAGGERSGLLHARDECRPRRRGAGLALRGSLGRS